MLKGGDLLVCIRSVGDITAGETYRVFWVQVRGNSNDSIMVVDDLGSSHWFGLEFGSFEWRGKFFVTEKEWLRNSKIDLICD